MNHELHIVGFKVGRETYGVPITSLREIVRVPEITAVPDAPDYVEGVINLRGKIVSVLDLRKRLGEVSVAPSKRNRILVVEHRATALRADRRLCFRRAQDSGQGRRPFSHGVRGRRTEPRDRARQVSRPADRFARH